MNILYSMSAMTSPPFFFYNIIARQKPLVRDAVHQLTRSELGRLAGIVVDMLCTSMIDVANVRIQPR
ncbi:hypothetical protein CK203_027891 [Vitis vinifera]|uniref:Uncharacterized protein n=1 Tax=Vitis vinifera TaxID=29760 RepID=A0A438J3P4_VITVI|nr:hypothetical protein CK203_027891 [Vitis vinifera]